jgi:hypothetical protein
MAERPPEVVEFAMGVVLGIIDQARDISPPDHLAPREALAAYADTVERIARDAFGDYGWDAFVAHVRATAARSDAARRN